MKNVFIENHQSEFSIKRMCRVLQVARSGLYAWDQWRAETNSRTPLRLSCGSVLSEAFRREILGYGAPRLTGSELLVHCEKRGNQPTSSRPTAESFTEVPPSQLPRTWCTSIRESAEAELLHQRPKQKWEVPSHIFAPVKAGFIWPWLTTCGHGG